MFLDASAIVGILNREPDAEALLHRLDAAEPPFYVSPLGLFEATLALARSHMPDGERVSAVAIDRARGILESFVAALGAQQIPITPEIGRGALDAAGLYGKVVGHPADLNFGDCFAYACAKAKAVPLLYKGRDFAQTDLA